MAERIAYWLMPEKNAFFQWRQVIDLLADRFGGVRFDPHVTLHIQDRTTEAEWRPVIDHYENQPLQLVPADLMFSGIFTRSCYVQFHRCSEILRLCGRIKSLSSRAADDDPDPHMSLYYGTLSETDRQRIQRLVNLPESIVFSSIRAVLLRNKVRGPEDVQAWETIGES